MGGGSFDSVGSKRTLRGTLGWLTRVPDTHDIVFTVVPDDKHMTAFPPLVVGPKIRGWDLLWGVLDQHPQGVNCVLGGDSKDLVVEYEAVYGMFTDPQQMEVIAIRLAEVAVQTG